MKKRLKKKLSKKLFIKWMIVKEQVKDFSKFMDEIQSDILKFLMIPPELLNVPQSPPSISEHETELFFEALKKCKSIPLHQSSIHTHHHPSE